MKQNKNMSISLIKLACSIVTYEYHQETKTKCKRYKDIKLTCIIATHGYYQVPKTKCILVNVIYKKRLCRIPS